jgi:hypothetical protein
MGGGYSPESRRHSRERVPTTPIAVDVLTAIREQRFASCFNYGRFALFGRRLAANGR